MIEWLMTFLGAANGGEFILLLAAVIGALVGLWVYGKKAVAGIRRQVVKYNNIHDALVGSGPILDPNTGEELRPAQRSMAYRVGALEESLERIAEAICRMAAIEETLAEIQSWQRKHEAWSDEKADEIEQRLRSHDHQETSS